MAAQKTKITTSASVPTVDPNATLEFEKITNSSEVPTFEKNASLKIDSVVEKVEEVPQEKLNKKLFILGTVGLGVIMLAAVAFFVFSSSQPVREEIKEVKAENTPAPTKPVKTVLNRQEWTFEVLNGSGIAGAAKKEAEKLEKLGYVVVATGNADDSNYKKTELFVKSSFMNKSILLIDDIKGQFTTIASVSGELTNSTASARIIVGRSNN